VRAAVVIAGEPEETRKRQDQQRRGEGQPCRPGGGLRSEPGVRRVAEQLRRVERGEGGTVDGVRVLERRPRGVDDGGPEQQEGYQRGGPPCVAPRRAAESTWLERHGAGARGRRHHLPPPGLRSSWSWIVTRMRPIWLHRTTPARQGYDGHAGREPS